MQKGPLTANKLLGMLIAFRQAAPPCGKPWLRVLVAWLPLKYRACRGATPRTVIRF
jgi:hypothetical protein